MSNQGHPDRYIFDNRNPPSFHICFTLLLMERTISVTDKQRVSAGGVSRCMQYSELNVGSQTKSHSLLEAVVWMHGMLKGQAVSPKMTLCSTGDTE